MRSTTTLPFLHTPKAAFPRTSQAYAPSMHAILTSDDAYDLKKVYSNHSCSKALISDSMRDLILSKMRSLIHPLRSYRNCFSSFNRHLSIVEKLRCLHST